MCSYGLVVILVNQIRLNHRTVIAIKCILLNKFFSLGGRGDNHDFFLSFWVIFETFLEICYNRKANPGIKTRCVKLGSFSKSTCVTMETQENTKFNSLSKVFSSCQHTPFRGDQGILITVVGIYKIITLILNQA